MRYGDLAELSAFDRVLRFLQANAALLGGIPTSEDQATLADVVDQLQALLLDQSTGRDKATGATAAQREACVSLRVEHMQPIATILLAKLTDVSDSGKFDVPNVRANLERVLMSATVLANAAEPHLPVLVAAGLQPDCVDQIRAIVASLEESKAQRSLERGRWIGATADIKAQRARGRAAVAVLDAAVTSALRGNSLLATWRSAKRVPAKPGPVAGAQADGQ